MHGTILIVEDERGIVALLEEVLAEEGYRVLTTRDGAEGLRRVRDEHPDLVVSNVQMPTLSGAAMARAIRADATLDGMPILLMSGAAASRGDAPYDGFLEKPFQIDTLIATITRLLDRARRQERTAEGAG